MFEQNPSDKQEITPEQAQAFIEAVKKHLPNLEPQVFLADELVATWLNVNPNADPEAARAAFKDHVSLSANSHHILGEELIILGYSETDDDISTELRVMHGYESDEKYLTFSRWMRVNNGIPVYTQTARLSNERGELVDMPVEEFLEKAAVKYPDLPEIYEEFLRAIVAPDANVFSAKVFAYTIEILEKLGPDTLDINYL